MMIDGSELEDEIARLRDASITPAPTRAQTQRPPRIPVPKRPLSIRMSQDAYQRITPATLLAPQPNIAQERVAGDARTT